MAGQGFFEEAANGLRLYLRATPNAADNAVTGIWRDADRNRRLAVKVTAPPDKGKANAAIIKLLATKLSLPKSALSVTAGETARLKTIHIEGEPGMLAAKLFSLMGERT